MRKNTGPVESKYFYNCGKCWSFIIIVFNLNIYYYFRATLELEQLLHLNLGINLSLQRIMERNGTNLISITIYGHICTFSKCMINDD
jgi:hypothetical protein